MYSGLGSFGCIHIIMGNKTSSEGGEGERGAKSGNSSYVGMDPALTGKRVSKFQSLREHLKDDHKSVFEQHALKLHDSNVLRVYEIYQEKLKASAKRMYKNQDLIVESMALRKKECKDCAGKLKGMCESNTTKVSNLKIECLALEDILAKTVADVGRLFEKAEQLDKTLVALAGDQVDGNGRRSVEIKDTLPCLQNQTITRTVSGIDEEINNL